MINKQPLTPRIRHIGPAFLKPEKMHIYMTVMSAPHPPRLIITERNNFAFFPMDTKRIHPMEKDITHAENGKESTHGHQPQ